MVTEILQKIDLLIDEIEEILEEEK